MDYDDLKESNDYTSCEYHHQNLFNDKTIIKVEPKYRHNYTIWVVSLQHHQQELPPHQYAKDNNRKSYSLIITSLFQGIV